MKKTRSRETLDLRNVVSEEFWIGLQLKGAYPEGLI